MPPRASEELFHSVARRGPSTHAIVIGIGKYFHLPGGGGPKTRYDDGMEQLSSPPRSARTFADWLIRHYDNPKAPLSTVALLVSKAGAASNAARIQGATAADVVPAIRAWKDRSDHEDDVMMFFFCGHGMAQGTDSSLLLADYGADDNSPYDGAIDLGRFLVGMERAAATHQIYFIDACRASSDSFAGARGGSTGVSVIMADPLLSNPKINPVFFSTLAGAQAYGRKGKVSVFTEALMKGLKDWGANDFNGGWEIWTDGLSHALKFHMDRAGFGKKSVPNIGNMSSFAFHNVTGIPKALAIVEPRQPLFGGTFVLSCRDAADVPQRVPGTAAPWEFELTAGRYKFQVGTPQATSPVKEREIRPPYRRVQVP